MPPFHQGGLTAKASPSPRFRSHSARLDASPPEPRSVRVLHPTVCERRKHLVDAFLEDGPVVLALCARGRGEQDARGGKAGFKFVHERAGLACEHVRGELIEVAVLEPAT